MISEGKKAAEKGEKEQPERLLKNKKIGITQIKRGRVQEGMMNSMRCDKIKQVMTKVATGFNIMEDEHSQDSQVDQLSM